MQIIFFTIFSTCLRYKICFIGADDTYSLEFMFFEKKGIELIGKSAVTLRKQYEPTSSPPDIAQWINHKFTFIVKVLYKKAPEVWILLLRLL